MSETGSVIGIDIGYSPKKRSSAIGRLTWNANRVDWTVSRFRYQELERKHVIEHVMGDGDICAAAFDGPLAPGFGPIGVYRIAERLLTSKLQPFIGKPGQASAPVGRLLNIAANEAAKIVSATNLVQPAAHRCQIDRLALAEAFPTSYLGVMLADPKSMARGRSRKSDRFFIAATMEGALSGLLHDLLPDRQQPDVANIINHDERAAYICALTALGVAKRRYTAVGDAEGGWIILPPWHLIQPWARQILEQNAAKEAALCLVIEHA